MASRHRWQALEWSCASWGEGERLGRARAVPLDRVAANVAVAQDRAGNLKPAKDKSTERIDRSSPPLWRSAAHGRPGRTVSRVLHVVCVNEEDVTGPKLAVALIINQWNSGCPLRPREACR